MFCHRKRFYKVSEMDKKIIIRDAGFISVTQQRIRCAVPDVSPGRLYRHNGGGVPDVKSPITRSIS